MIIWIITVVFDSVIDFCFNWEFVLQGKTKQQSRSCLTEEIQCGLGFCACVVSSA